MTDFHVGHCSGPAGVLVCGAGGPVLAQTSAKKLFKKEMASWISSGIAFLFSAMLLNSFIGKKHTR